MPVAEDDVVILGQIFQLEHYLPSRRCPAPRSARSPFTQGANLGLSPFDLVAGIRRACMSPSRARITTAEITFRAPPMP